MKSLNYFIAVPKWVYNLYISCALGLAVVASLAIPAYLFFDTFLYFDPSDAVATGNYFVDSYATRMGRPVLFVSMVLSLAGGVSVLGALYMLRNVLKSSRDTYFIVGLLFSVFAAIKENFLLPFTFEYFVPVIFLSNLFEAFRMNSLSYREYMKEKGSVKKSKAPEAEKYQNSNLSEERIQELAVRVKEVLEKDKLFMNPNLNSEDLAKKIGIPSYQLSQVVNIGINTTFFELLSHYRIEEVKKKLKDDEYSDETIINIAYSSGFNSKSAFNTAFKKQTGVTPSVFRKKD